MFFYSPYLYTLQRQRIAMQSAPYKNYNAKDFAIKTGISLSHYEHLYRQFFSKSFKKDLIAMRIKYAKELLINSELSVEQIAYSCGYNSEVHFYRQFKLYAGVSPGEFRKRHGI